MIYIDQLALQTYFPYCTTWGTLYTVLKVKINLKAIFQKIDRSKMRIYEVNLWTIIEFLIRKVLVNYCSWIEDIGIESLRPRKKFYVGLSTHMIGC